MIHLQEPAEKLLRENINQLLARNGAEMAQEMVIKAIVWFGAALGFIIGGLNCLIL